MNDNKKPGGGMCGEPGGRIADGAGLAHDAGNLLGALRLYCDLLARPGVLRAEHHHYAEELQLLSLRSGTLIDRLLNPAATRRRERMDTVPGPAAMTGSAVPEVVEQCRGLLNTIARRAVAVSIGEGTGICVPASREALERILVNLTKNAAEASAGGGAITLRVSRVEERGAVASKAARARIVLSVEDQGRGMSVAAVKVLLEGKAAAPGGLVMETPERVGRGIGLRVVRELVRESGGELRLKSRSGCGTGSGTTVEIAWAVASDGVGAWMRGRQDAPAAWDGNGTGNRNKATQGRVSC